MIWFFVLLSAVFAYLDMPWGALLCLYSAAMHYFTRKEW